MSKSLLSLVLLATQTLSLGGAPLYLCVCDCDSICFDAGPESCTCCHDQDGVERDGEDHDRHVANHDQAATVLRIEVDECRDATISSASCECRHLELGSGAISLAVQSSSRHDMLKARAFLSIDVMSIAVRDFATWAPAPDFCVAGHHSAALAERATIALRC